MECIQLGMSLRLQFYSKNEQISMRKGNYEQQKHVKFK